MRVHVGRPVSLLSRVIAWLLAPQPPITRCSACHEVIEGERLTPPRMLICCTPGGRGDGSCFHLVVAMS